MEDKFKISYDGYDRMLEKVKKMDLQVDSDWVPTIAEIKDFLKNHDTNRKTVMFMEWIRMQPQLGDPEQKKVKKYVCDWLYKHVEFIDERPTEDAEPAEV